MQFGLVLGQVFLIGGDNGVGHRCDSDIQLGVVRAGDDGVQPAVELIGQTPADADDALRGAVIA
jgi:hypothetical protein